MGTSANATKLTITRDEGHLLVKFPFLPKPLVIEPTSPRVFAMPNTYGRFTFQENDGKVTGAVFEIGDGERAMKKVEQ